MKELKHIKQWNCYYDVWTCYINTLIYYSFNKNMALREVQQMFNDAMERKNEYGQGIAYYTMGSVYLNMNHLDESAAAFQKSIKLLRQQTPPPVYTPEVFSYLGDVLNEQEKYDDLQKLTVEWQEFIPEFLKSYPQLKQEYQNILWFYYHIACAQAAIGQDRLDDAEVSTTHAEETRGTDDSYETLQWLVTKAQLRLRQGRLAEALELNTQRLNMVPPNEDKGVFLSVARQRGEILTRLHRYEESSRLYREMYRLKDSISGIMLVIRYAMTTYEDLANCMKQIELAKVNMLGFVLNDVHHNHGANYYNYKYKYKKYGYGYGSYGDGYTYGNNPTEETKENENAD